VISGLKPGFDAARVLNNKEVERYNVFDAKAELTITKCAEMFAESIPGCILQIYAFLIGAHGTKKNQALVSIVVSALTTGVSSATVAYDFDSDPEKRKATPAFYGYLPDAGSKRTIMFLALLVNSTLLVLLRSFGAALLMIVDGNIFAAYFGLDMACYLLQKTLRSDFHYWLPVGGVPGLGLSLLLRVVVKTVADFTGLVHMRASQELGGMYVPARLSSPPPLPY
jgi:hypothetical protein